MLNSKVIYELLEKNKKDSDIIELIENCLMSFEDYHRTVYRLEIYKQIYTGRSSDVEVYREQVANLDKSRTVCHNSVIANVRILNRLAAQQGCPPVYEGIVSEDRPYRREIANAVFAYVEQVIQNRG